MKPVSKNGIVRDMCTWLAEKYATNRFAIDGLDHTEARFTGGAYVLKKKDPLEPLDLRGFALDKALCTYPPRSDEDLASAICTYLQTRTDAKYEKKDSHIHLSCKDGEYWIFAHSGLGSADEIVVNFHKGDSVPSDVPVAPCHHSGRSY